MAKAVERERDDAVARAESAERERDEARFALEATRNTLVAQVLVLKSERDELRISLRAADERTETLATRMAVGALERDELQRRIDRVEVVCQNDHGVDVPGGLPIRHPIITAVRAALRGTP